MNSDLMGALLTIGGIGAIIVTIAMFADHAAWPKDSTIKWIKKQHRGLVVSLLLTLPLLYVVGWTHYGELKAGEDRARAEQHQRDMEMIGPPGPPGRPGFDLCSACGAPGPDGLSGTEPWAKPRDDR